MDKPMHNAIKSQAKSIGLVGKTKVKKPTKKADQISKEAQLTAGLLESVAKLDVKDAELERHTDTIEAIIDVLKSGNYTAKKPKNL